MQRLLCAVVLSRSGRYPDHGNSPQPVDLAIGSAGNVIPSYADPDRKSIGHGFRGRQVRAPQGVQGKKCLAAVSTTGQSGLVFPSAPETV